MGGPVPFDELQCPRCGAVGSLVVRGDGIGMYDEAPVECEECGRQHVGRRVPLEEAFDFTGGTR